MWTASIEPFDNPRKWRYSVMRDGMPVTYFEVIRGWCHDAEFRRFWSDLLAAAPAEVYRWETPPITSFTGEQPFEFVLVDRVRMIHDPDRTAFANYLDGPDARRGAVVFPNLGHDALLVVPCQFGPRSAYGHLAAFVRSAPEEQRHVFWQVVGETVQERLSNLPVWVSTAGMGVPWLHVRVCDEPKYYCHWPYHERPSEYR